MFTCTHHNLLIYHSLCPHSGPLPQTSSKKSGRKQVPLGSGVKSKQYGSGGKRAAKSDTGSEKASEIESEIFPDIETMSRKEEPDESKNERDVVIPWSIHVLYISSLKKLTMYV